MQVIVYLQYHHRLHVKLCRDLCMLFFLLPSKYLHANHDAMNLKIDININFDLLRKVTDPRWKLLC